MHLSYHDGLNLVAIQPPQLPAHCRNGIYICCNSGGVGHNGSCGLHLWVWGAPDPIPHHNVLLAAIHRDVPHCNGQGSHEA